jgi:hypothetical protein
MAVETLTGKFQRVSEIFSRIGRQGYVTQDELNELSEIIGELVSKGDLGNRLLVPIASTILQYFGDIPINVGNNRVIYPSDILATVATLPTVPEGAIVTAPRRGEAAESLGRFAKFFGEFPVNPEDIYAGYPKGAMPTAEERARQASFFTDVAQQTGEPGYAQKALSILKTPAGAITPTEQRLREAGVASALSTVLGYVPPELVDIFFTTTTGRKTIPQREAERTLWELFTGLTGYIPGAGE